jgi:hypothetical protein
MKLTQALSMDSGDWFVIWKSNEGDFRGISITDLMTSVQSLLTLGRPEADTQYAAPSATGFSVAIVGAELDHDVHLILTPVAGYANGTIILPAASGCRDKQLVIVNCTQAVTALAITLNGATAVTGAPTALLANGFFTLCYDLASKTWYRIA